MPLLWFICRSRSPARFSTWARQSRSGWSRRWFSLCRFWANTTRQRSAARTTRTSLNLFLLRIFRTSFSINPSITRIAGSRRLPSYRLPARQLEKEVLEAALAAVRQVGERPRRERAPAVDDRDAVHHLLDLGKQVARH